jgi:anti-anti-sigma factor
MRIHEQPIDEGILWRLEGRLSHTALDLLERAAASPLVPWRRVVLDLSGVSMIDAAGVGAVVTAYRTCAERGVSVSLVGVPARVLHVLTILRLTDVLPIFDSAEEAVHRGGAAVSGTAPSAAIAGSFVGPGLLVPPIR